MKFSELSPIRMTRVAVVAPRLRLREALVEIADAGVMEVDEIGAEDQQENEPAERLRDVPDDVGMRIAREPPDLDRIAEEGAWDLVAGEAELTRRRNDCVEHGPASILVGWVPEAEFDDFSGRLAERGTSVVERPRPPTVEPPTRMADEGLRRLARPLVRTYSVVPYEDVDPSIFAAVTYVLMFGMMFGDVGHGLILAVAGALLARSEHPRLQVIRRLWVFPFAAGLAATVFGLLYGEAFGPTGLVPTLWLAPMEEPVRLLVTALGIGAGLVGVSYVFGTVNRWREGGPNLALYASTGIAGASLFFGGTVLAGGFLWRQGLLQVAGGGLVAVGTALVFIGFYARAGSGGGALGEAAVEVFDTITRIIANVLSFGRLAAFGLTHAALGSVVWQGTSSLGEEGGFLTGAGAALLFLVGNAVAFSLEALVVGVQALRLEYYELFSRVFAGQGRLFDPWHIPIATEE